MQKDNNIIFPNTPCIGTSLTDEDWSAEIVPPDEVIQNTPKDKQAVSLYKPDRYYRMCMKHPAGIIIPFDDNYIYKRNEREEELKKEREAKMEKIFIEIGKAVIKILPELVRSLYRIHSEKQTENILKK